MPLVEENGTTFSERSSVGSRALITALMAFCLASSTLLAQETVRTFRDWEAFSPGAWKKVRVHRQTFDEQENIASTSMTDTKTTLTEKDDKGFTLCVTVSVEVAGQKFPSAPQSVWY